MTVYPQDHASVSLSGAMTTLAKTGLTFSRIRSSVDQSGGRTRIVAQAWACATEEEARAATVGRNNPWDLLHPEICRWREDPAGGAHFTFGGVGVAVVVWPGGGEP